MARPEKEPTTELAKRLREIRHTFGFTERKQFAKYFDIPETTMRNYETGLREPPASIMRIYKDRCGISLDWLVTGEGEMFSDMAKAKAAGFKAPTIPAGLMKKLGRIAYTTYRDAKIKLPPEDIAELAAGTLWKTARACSRHQRHGRSRAYFTSFKIAFKASNRS